MFISLNNEILKKNRSSFILLLIIFLGLLYRLYLFNLYPFVTFDSAEYARLGKNLIEYGNYSFSHNGGDNVGVVFPPGYPLLIGLANLVFNDLFISGTIVSLLAGLLSIYLIYLIAKELFGVEAGLFAAFCLAVCLPIADLSAKIMSESLYLLFILCLFFLFISNNKNYSNSKIFILGIISGFVFLTKPEGILFLALPLISVYLAKKEKKIEMKKAIAGVLLSILSFAFIASPYLLFLKNKTGNFILSGKNSINIAAGEFLGGNQFSKIPASDYYRNFYTLNEENTKIVRSKELSESLLESVSRDARGFLSRYLKNIWLEFYEISLYILPTPLVFLLFFSLSNKRHRVKETYVLLFISLLFILILPIYQIQQRFLFPVFLFLIIISSPSYVEIKKLIGGFFAKHRHCFSCDLRNVKAFIIILFLAGVVFPPVRYIHPEFIEHKKAGDFIRKNISGEYEKINVMAVKSTVCFYANSRCTILPCAQTDRIIKYAENKTVDYIVIDERYAGSYPNYKELINLDKINSEFKMVYESKNPSLIRIFKAAK